MTKLLEKAFSEASKLPEEDQNALADMLLDDIASEERWADAFTGSQAELAALAVEALAEFRRGETKPLDEL
jgi:hypothetical protein